MGTRFSMVEAKEPTLVDMRNTVLKDTVLFVLYISFRDIGGRVGLIKCLLSVLDNQILTNRHETAKYFNHS